MVVRGSPVAIAIDGLTKTEGHRRLLDELDLRVPEGEACGILGPQGAGKTTLARILVGLEPASEGNVRIDGDPLEAASAGSKLGYVPARAGFDEDRTPRQLLRLGGRLHGLGPSRRERRLERLLIDLRLEHLGGHAIAHLDDGQRRRLALAYALVHDPRVLVVDEPTLGLGPGPARRVREALADLAGDRTLLVLTADADDVEHVCERVVGLEDGRVVVDAPVDEVSAEHGIAVEIRLDGPLHEDALDRLREHEAVAALRRDPDDASADLELWLTSPERASDVLGLLVDEGAPVASFAPRHPPLAETVGEHMEAEL